MRKTATLLLTAAALLLAACVDQPAGTGGAIDKGQNLKGDSTVYGLACDGSTDSTLVFLPNAGGDPVTYNIVRATRENQVFGTLDIGDWVGVVVNPVNRREALVVIDLDQLKGTWTYQVMPTLKKSKTKSQSEIEAELTDSMRQLYFVPREYGWTLKRHWQAATVGMVYRGNSLADESPVEYPPVKNFTGWRIYNGLLIMARDTIDANRRPIPTDRVEQDTNRLVHLSADSLCVLYDGQLVGFRRQKSARAANEKAQAAAQKEAEATEKRQ